MTVNFNQYKVGPEPCSTTFPSITSYSPTPITILSNALIGPTQLEYNGHFPLHGLQSRARCRTPPVQPSVTCPGERGLTSFSVGVAASVSSSRMDVDTERLVISQRMDGWPECFQDLRSWCHPDQDELNTPQITLQDEFNFNLEGQVNNCGDWGYVQSPAELNDSWVNQELLLPSPNNVLITDEENNNYSGDNQSSFSLPYMKVDMAENMNNKIDYTGILIGADSSSVLKTKGNVLLSQATLPREDSPTVGEATVKFTDYIKLNSSQLVRLGNGGKLIKSERVEEPRVPAVEHHPPPVVFQQENSQHLPVVQKDGGSERSRLKLSIPQAPPTTNESSTGTLPTPEVLKPLTDIPTSQFDLLKYVCEGQDFTSKSQIIPKTERIASAQDHDYTDSKSTSNENIYIKCEPLSPSRHFDGIAGVKRTMSLDDEDYDSDPSLRMDDDSESEEWSPSVKRSRRSSITGGPKRRGRQPSIVSIDSSDGPDKYRALRDRNNEASRRSRLNRKQRDMEMRRHKTELEKRNLELRVKADRMESLVKEMRAALLKSIKNSRNNSS